MHFAQGCHTVLIYKICRFLKVRVLKSFVVLISQKCSYFELASLLCLIFSTYVRNHIATITI